MNRNILLVIIVVLLLAVVVILPIGKYAATGNGTLINPGARKLFSRPATASVPTPAPQAPVYNPPKEIKYGNATDLKKELETLNPQVLDSDFE